MVSPPLPMTAPIFSGSILTVVMRGAHGESSSRGCRDVLVHDAQDVLTPGLGLRERVLEDLERHAR